MQIFTSFSFSVPPSTKSLSNKFDANRPAKTTTADEFVESATPHSDIPPSTHERELHELVRTRRRAHFVSHPNPPSAPAPKLPAVTRRAQSSHRAPTPRRPQKWTQRSHIAPRPPSSQQPLHPPHTRRRACSRAHPHPTAPPPLAHRAGRRPALGQPARPQREARGRRPSHAASRSGHHSKLLSLEPSAPLRAFFRSSGPAARIHKSPPI